MEKLVTTRKLFIQLRLYKFSFMSLAIHRVYSEVMTTDCRSALLEIQYFVARDFRLDAQLYSQVLNKLKKILFLS